MVIKFDTRELSLNQRKALASLIVDCAGGVDEDVVSTASLPAIEEAQDQTPEQAFTLAAPTANVSVITQSSEGSAVPAENDRLDKDGLPWDDRIHASSRVKVADGTWRKRRGIDEATVATVEAELKALMGLPVPPAPAPVPTPAAAFTAPAVAVLPASPTPIAAVPAPPPPAPVDDKQAFVQLIAKASAALNAKTLTQEQLTAAVVAAGVPSLPLLSNRPDLIPTVSTTLDTLIASAA